MTGISPFELLAHEARGLLSRIAQLRPFALRIPTVAAAAASRDVLEAVEAHVERGSAELHGRVREFLASLRQPGLSAEVGQRRLTFLRLRFNAVLNELDLFADALAQRSEHGLGTHLAGLDALADDALSVRGVDLQPPPIVCYVDRGLGAAVRRARTRLPTGRANPVTIVRVPRERMIGAGVASSLVHEVGHQGAALLELVPSLRPVLAAFSRSHGAASAWALWERWISEIVADFWAVAKVGISAPLGLLAVVSLPGPFVFRINADDPHPTPWIRVKLGCAIGEALFPHPQWAALARTWNALYPRQMAKEAAPILERLEAGLPALVTLIATHRPRALAGRTLAEALIDPERSPRRIAARFTDERSLREAQPTEAFCALGQARAEGRITAERETQLISGLLTRWALRRIHPPPLRPAARFALHATLS